MGMLDHLGDVRVFVRVADAASFTIAAERLGISRSSVGKCITRLEESLSTRLVHRTTRSVRLTDEGNLFYDHAMRILCEADDAEVALAQRNQAPTGRLRLDVPVAIGRLHILPVLQQFLAKWPDLEADVTFSDDYRDLVAEGIDVAIRLGGPSDSRLIRQVLAPHGLVTCAAPAYLERRGCPETPDELQHHEKIAFSYCNALVPWRFRISGENRDLVAQGSLRLNNTEAIRDAALAGTGIVQLGAFLVDQDIKCGRLIPMLQTFGQQSDPVCAVYPTRRNLTPKVRLFIAEVRKAWAECPPWETGLFPQG
jgi:DNA-binding transcriptional LysR family regulator